MSPQGCGARDRIRGGSGRSLHAIGLAAGLIAAALLHGCAPMPAPPTPPRPGATPSSQRPRPRAGYEGRIDTLATDDAWALRGKRIALDPGHGGIFRGALGVKGLTEAEVNLGVALHVRGLLEARGAVVFMTRTDDRDFLTPADSSLRADLTERMRLANGFHPDLFVSIHHNADARGAHDKNETQTYYKLGDDGPSLDAARSVHRFLVRELGIEQHRILPGNYFVLRNSDAPAILTESSYITNPDVEAKLALAAKQRLEAEAIFLGLARYFALPRPVVEEFVARAGAGGPVDTLFEHAAPEFMARIVGPFDAVVLTIDGARVPVHREGTAVTSAPSPLANGAHVAMLHVGFAGGGWARSRTLRFTVRRPASALVARAMPERASPRVGTVAVATMALDATGAPVDDSLRVRVTSPHGTGFSPAETTVVARHGRAWAYFSIPRSAAAHAGTERDFGASVPRASGRAPIAATAALRLVPESEAPVRGVMLRTMPGDSALLNAPGTEDSALAAMDADPDRWINRDGFAVLSLDAEGRPILPRLPGYRPWASDAPWPPRLTAIAGGALHRRRIVIDPDGGGDDDAGTGRSGTRAANVNLEVARALAGFLEAAGATVRLTRDGDFALSDVERVQASEAFHADRFIRIAHRAEPPTVGYYFSSAVDHRWAERTAALLPTLGLGAPRPAEDAQYVLQQTSCPSIYVSASRIDDPAAEERLVTPAGMRAEAYALYLGTIGEWRDTQAPLDSLTVIGADGRTAPGAAVTLGGTILLLSDARGRVRFARTEPGPLEVDIDHPAVRAHRVLLDSMSGVTVTGVRKR